MPELSLGEIGMLHMAGQHSYTRGFMKKVRLDKMAPDTFLFSLSLFLMCRTLVLWGSMHRQCDGDRFAHHVAQSHHSPGRPLCTDVLTVYLFYTANCLAITRLVSERCGVCFCRPVEARAHFKHLHQNCPYEALPFEAAA